VPLRVRPTTLLRIIFQNLTANVVPEFLKSRKPTIVQITKAEILQEGIFFLIHLFARDVLVMKKSKPTFITSVLKVEY
jgi:hypothetical protein